MEQFMKEVGDIVAPKEEDDDAVHPYEQLEKAKVLQDARIFHDSVLVRESPRKCCRILAQILFMQNDPRHPSSKLTQTEATELFFASTKLFVDAEDASLRRLVYLFIKEIQPLCDPSDVIIVTSCLTKDMTCDVGLYRANAIRVLVNIIDSAMLGSIERYIKQAIVDNDMQVSNAALVAASHLFSQSTDNATIVKRWIGEVQEMLTKQSSSKKKHSDNDMVQANAMRLLCQMKGHDRLGMAKLVQKFSGQAGSGIQSPFAIVILIRLCGKLLVEELSTYGHNNGCDVRGVSSLSKLCFEFLESSLLHPTEMISYEAARTICLLPNLDTSDLTLAMKCLRGMLFSDKPTIRFAAAGTLSHLTNQPRSVALCNDGLENCISDDNKQIATMAVTTLLKTGSESTIDKMLGILPTLLDSLEEDYKIALIGSLEELCLKYPPKHKAVVRFLASLLADEAGIDFKRSIVNSIVSLMKQVPETIESSLLHLCDFIDDCEYPTLSCHTIHVIAQLAPKTSAPSQYIRFIYNRVILENATVRAAAVSALSIIAAYRPSLRSSITALLKQSLNDEDDETRDRASVSVSVLNEAMVLNPYVAQEVEDYDEIVPDNPSEGDLAALAFLQPLPMSFRNLERSIKAYVSTPGATDSAEKLSFSVLPFIEDKHDDETSSEHELANVVSHMSATEKAPDPATSIYAIPELAEFGRVYRSSAPISLTEDETEYVVKCIKHILDQHVILQFIIQNTVEEMQLQNITVELEGDSDDDSYEIIGDVPAEKAEYGKTVSAFAVLQRQCPFQSIKPVCFSTCQLNFTAVPVDAESGEPLGDGYTEEYPLEHLTIAPSDYMARVAVPDFRAAWNGTDDGNESLGKFTMQSKTMDHALSSLTELLGMAACDGTGRVLSSSDPKRPHMLHLSGRFLGGHEVLARAQLAVKPGEGTLMKIAIRSTDKAVSDTVMSCIT